MTKKELGLGIYGLDAHDEVWIRAVLSVALPNLRHEWSLTGLDRAQVLICRPNSMLQPEVKARVLEKVLILHHGERPVPGALVLHAPLRSANLLNILNHCGDLLDLSKNRFFGAVPNASERQLMGLRIPKEMAWLNDLHQLMMAHQDAAVLIDGRHCYSVLQRERRLYYVDREAAVISSEHLVYAWSKESLDGFKRWQTVPLEMIKPVQSLTHNHDAWPLEHLLWKLGHLLSQQNVLPGPLSGKAYQLCRWPDYGQIGAHRSYFLLSAALTRHPHTFAELKALTELSNSQIYSVLHSALCCNLLIESETHTATTVAVESPPLRPEAHGMTRMLGVLRQALGLRSL